MARINSKRSEMPLTYILEVELFDWVEAIACPTSDARVVTKFLHKNIFTWFCTSRVVISNEGSHFINKVVALLLAKYNIKHKVSTTYHHQSNSQAKISNREIKSILEKLELQHKAFWTLKKLNLDYAAAGDLRHLQLLKLEEFRRDAYENTKIYKEMTKRWHDARIQPKHFEKGQQVLLYNSRLKFFPVKLKSRWFGQFFVAHVFPHGAIRVQEVDSGREFIVNSQRMRHYYGEEVVRDVRAPHFAAD
ncbi:uncharacterized protein LOC111021006 [Momordica charantia]|uniref:Uncharacterized protein LOC111021006 n=1 Tax=Momordica charantia TaxID=3673 RepID=A0A6J1DJ54_MOMCH|nr:uncharacterized protein LOC111021006 [Momordica charantia]